jgi:hypothetical protein
MFFVQLLAPFITSEDIGSLDRLLHQRNKQGQQLLGLVVHHRQNLLVRPDTKTTFLSPWLWVSRVTR